MVRDTAFVVGVLLALAGVWAFDWRVSIIAGGSMLAGGALYGMRP